MYECKVCNINFERKEQLAGHNSGHSRRLNPAKRSGEKVEKAPKEKLIWHCDKCDFITDNGLKRGAHVRYHQLDFNSLRSEGTRKIWLLRERGHRCESCNSETWLSSVIPLELDHVDGNSDNNCRENLRLLCPNCHALQPTSHGKNVGKFPYAKRSLGRAKYYKKASE